MRLEIVVNRRISEVRIHAYNILILGRIFEQGGRTTCENGTFADFPIKLGTLWRVVQLKMGNEKSNLFPQIGIWFWNTLFSDNASLKTNKSLSWGRLSSLVLFTWKIKLWIVEVENRLSFGELKEILQLFLVFKETA